MSIVTVPRLRNGPTSNSATPSGGHRAETDEGLDEVVRPGGDRSTQGERHCAGVTARAAVLHRQPREAGRRRSRVVQLHVVGIQRRAAVATSAEHLGDDEAGAGGVRRRRVGCECQRAGDQREGGGSDRARAAERNELRNMTLPWAKCRLFPLPATCILAPASRMRAHFLGEGCATSRWRPDGAAITPVEQRG